MLRRILSCFAIPAVRLYMSAERSFTKDGMKIIIPVGVFNPALFGSSLFLYDHLRRMSLQKKAILEIGTGSGLLSALCVSKGAAVTACDISAAAVEATRMNLNRNGLSAHVIQSDLFTAIERTSFDHIIINPPYYKRKVEREEQHAWNAGEDYGYFKRLFSDIRHYLSSKGSLIMVVSSDCDLVLIRLLAKNAGMNCETVEKQRYFFERQFILHFSFA